MWNCIEERINDQGDFGRLRRKLLFDDIFADRRSFLSKEPLSSEVQKQLQMGDSVIFYEDAKINEGRFVSSSSHMQMTAKDILSKLLNSEEDIRTFCSTNGLGQNLRKSEHVFALVIEAFLFLTKKLDFLYDPEGTHRPPRKRVFESNIDDSDDIIVVSKTSRTDNDIVMMTGLLTGSAESNAIYKSPTCKINYNGTTSNTSCTSEKEEIKIELEEDIEVIQFEDTFDSTDEEPSVQSTSDNPVMANRSNAKNQHTGNDLWLTQTLTQHALSLNKSAALQKHHNDKTEIITLLKQNSNRVTFQFHREYKNVIFERIILDGKRLEIARCKPCGDHLVAISRSRSTNSLITHLKSRKHLSSMQSEIFQSPADLRQPALSNATMVANNQTQVSHDVTDALRDVLTGRILSANNTSVT